MQPEITISAKVAMAAFLSFQLLIPLLVTFLSVSSDIDINQRCFETPNQTNLIPHCFFRADLVLRQKCARNRGLVMVLDEQAAHGSITCFSRSPMEVEVDTPPESFLSYGEKERFTIIHGRVPANNAKSSIQESYHRITSPLVHNSTNYILSISSPPIRLTIRNAGSKKLDQEIGLLVMSGGSPVIFAMGNPKPVAQSEVIHIPCLYDYTSGIRSHSLDAYVNEEKITLSMDPDSYDPLRGLRFDLTKTPNLYSNHTFHCSGESPSVNPFLIGAAVDQPGFGVEYRAGITYSPNVYKYECFMPPCTVYCEYDHPIQLKISDSGVITEKPGKLLFKTFENVTRYGVEFTAKENGEIQCMQLFNTSERVLHSWKISQHDILNPLSEAQTLQMKVESLKHNGENATKIQCISNTEQIESFVQLPCSNHLECKFYSECIHREKDVKLWQSGWTIPKNCSATPNTGKMCQIAGDKRCREMVLSDRSTGKLFCTASNGVVFESNYFMGFDGSLVFHNELQSIEPTKAVMLVSHHTGVKYSGGAFDFSCESSSFCTEHGLEWKVKWKNGSISVPRILDDCVMNVLDDYLSGGIWLSSINPQRRSRIVLESENVVALVCSAPLIHENGWIEKEISLKIKKSIAPTLKLPKTAYFDVGSKASLECSADGSPEPEARWLVETDKLKSNNIFVESRGKASILQFTTFTEEDAGNYVCQASNGIYNTTEKVTVAINTKSWPTIVIVMVAVFVILIAVVALASFYRRWKLTQKMIQKISDAELDEFMNGIEGYGHQEEYRFVFPALAVPYDTKYEMDREKFDFDTNAFLGSGQFGVVYRGILKSTERSNDVAIKSLKSACRREDILSFLSEVKLMIYLGHHAHLVEIIGACTKNCRRGELFLLLEFCDQGSLLKHLQNLNDLTTMTIAMPSNIQMAPSEYANIVLGKEGHLTELIQWSYEISCGMEYIASKGLIHGDLAARNVLLITQGNKIIAKISDFGLSRKLYEYAHYVKTKQEPLPWRWLSPESIRQLKFSIKSDVWAYAICLWEIFSLGDVPYSGYTYDMEFLNLLENGFRNPKPKYVPDLIFELMKRCWLYKTEERPSFTDIKAFFENEFTGANQVCKIIPYYTNIL